MQDQAINSQDQAWLAARLRAYVLCTKDDDDGRRPADAWEGVTLSTDFPESATQ